MSEVTKRIDEVLKLRGVTKQEFYAACNITSSAYSQWNTEKTVPRLSTLKKISDYLDINYEWIAFGLGNKEKKSTQEDRHNQQLDLDDEQLKVAYFRGADPSLTKEDLDAMWEDAKNFRDFILEKKRREKHGE